MRWAIVLLLICLAGVTTLAQTVPPEGENLENLGDKILSFIQSAADLMGQGLVSLINLILPTGHEVSQNLAIPLGYLGLLTLVLFLFGVLEAARKVIWLVVGVGWVLMVVRIVLDALGV